MRAVRTRKTRHVMACAASCLCLVAVACGLVRRHITGRSSAPPVLDVDLAALDPSVPPCADFYQFACGGWKARTPIPPDRPAWSRSFSEISERNLTILRDTLEADASGHFAPGDDEARKLGDFYATCMDEKKAETASEE